MSGLDTEIIKFDYLSHSFNGLCFCVLKTYGTDFKTLNRSIPYALLRFSHDCCWLRRNRFQCFTLLKGRSKLGSSTLLTFIEVFDHTTTLRGATDVLSITKVY